MMNLVELSQTLEAKETEYFHLLLELDKLRGEIESLESALDAEESANAEDLYWESVERRLA